MILLNIMGVFFNKNVWFLLYWFGNQYPMNRKTFIKNTTMMGAGGMFLPGLKSYALSKSTQDISANDQINIGSIGINGMGWGNTLKAI